VYHIIYQHPSDNQFQKDDIEIYMLYLGRRTVNTCGRHFAGKKMLPLRRRFIINGSPSNSIRFYREKKRRIWSWAAIAEIRESIKKSRNKKKVSRKCKGMHRETRIARRASGVNTNVCVRTRMYFYLGTGSSMKIDYREIGAKSRVPERRCTA